MVEMSQSSTQAIPALIAPTTKLMSDRSSTRGVVLKSASGTLLVWSAGRQLAEVLGRLDIRGEINISHRDISQTKTGISSLGNASVALMPSSKPLSKSQYENLASFRFALRKFLRFSEDAAHNTGITPQQHQALLAIKGFPGREHVDVRELAERLQVRHHSAVGLIDRLAAEKLVARTPSPEDRRRVQIRLTSRGEKVLAKLAAAHREQLRRIGPELSLLLQRLGKSDSGAT
jgi:DNA-binding MarR family transcriptional regulator